MSSGSCGKGFQALALDVVRRIEIGAGGKAAGDAGEPVPVGTVLFGSMSAAGTLLRGVGGMDVNDAAACPLHLVVVLAARLAGRDIQQGPVQSGLLRDVGAGFLDRAFGRSGHVGDLQVFHAEHRDASDHRRGHLVLGVVPAPRVARLQALLAPDRLPAVLRTFLPAGDGFLDDRQLAALLFRDARQVVDRRRSTAPPRGPPQRLRPRSHRFSASARRSRTRPGWKRTVVRKREAEAVQAGSSRA